MHGGAEGLPDAPVAGVVGQHSFRMKLKADQKWSFRIVEGFDQAVVGVGHRFEAGCQIADALMVIAVHLQGLFAVPATERSAVNKRHAVPIGVVVLACLLDVL